MRVLVLECVASCLVVGCATSDATETAKQQLMTRVGLFGDAYQAGDTEALAAMLTEDYRHINDGHEPIGKEKWLEWTRLRGEKLTAGSWRVDRYEVTDLEVTLYQESAVVMGRVESSGERDGRPFSADIRFVNHWVIDRGDWKRAAFFDAPSNPQN